MKSFRRLIIVLLVLIMALVINSFVSSAAVSQQEAEISARELYDLNLFQGTGYDLVGNPNFDLNRQPTRLEAVTMLVRLIGKEEEAKVLPYTAPFTDVAAWAKPYVNYAYWNGLTSGTSPTTYGGSALITPSQYLTFVLRSLGYYSGIDFAWDRAWELSDTLGITYGQYNDKSLFNRGDVAVISNKAIHTHCRDSELTLEETYLGDIQKPKPTSAQIYTPTPAYTPAPSYNTSGGTNTYIINVNTLIFHRPDCKSVKLMNEQNKSEFKGTAEQLINMGYDPCQNCNPDTNYVPVNTPVYTPTPTYTPAPSYSTSGGTNTYIINVNTLKFHYPDCKSVKRMNEENKSVFNGTREQLISNGYAPCQNCNP